MESIPSRTLLFSTPLHEHVNKVMQIVLKLDSSTILDGRVSGLLTEMREHWIVRIKCLPDFPVHIVITYDPKKNDPNNPWESYLRISNGLKPSDPKYEGALLRVRLTNDGHIIVDVLECTDGFSVGVPSRHLKPLRPIKVQTVHQYGGTYVTLNGKSVSPFVSPEFQPLIQETVTETVRSLDRQVVWEDDAFIDPEPA